MVTWHDGLTMWQSRIAGAFGPVGLELLQQYVRQLRLLSGLGANSALVALASYQVEQEQSNRLRSSPEVVAFLQFLEGLPVVDRSTVFAMIGEELYPLGRAGLRFLIVP